MFRRPHNLLASNYSNIHSQTKYHLQVPATFLIFWGKMARASTTVTIQEPQITGTLLLYLVWNIFSCVIVKATFRGGIPVMEPYRAAILSNQ